MLSALPSPQQRGAAPTRRPPRPLRVDYQEFILQRIEEYKNTLGREQLLEIGDEAVQELEASAGGQYLLTEVLLLEHVDRIIARRLKLPSFRRWTDKHCALRAAQREPTHWGLDGQSPLVSIARRLEPGDLTVVVGAAALPAALFLAAHDVEVFLVDQDLRAVESAEQRAITEQLAGRFQALVVQFGSWFPDVLPTLVVIEPAALAAPRARDRNALLADLQARTRQGGVHVVLPSGDGGSGPSGGGGGGGDRARRDSARARILAIAVQGVANRASQAQPRVQRDQAAASAGHGAERVRLNTERSCPTSRRP